jgi:hypothetical protein
MEKRNIFFAVAAVLGLCVASTFLLPDTVQLERSAIVEAAPQAVLGLAASNEGYQRFNPYKNTDPSLQITHFGPQSGVGSGFEFVGKEGQGKQTVISQTYTRVGYEIDMGSMGKPTQSITARAHPKGSEVVWTMEMELGANPVMRVFGLAMDGMIGPTLETGLSNLNQALKPA